MDFDDEVSGCTFLMFTYNMDILYIKFFLIVLVLRAICTSHAKYDEMVGTRGVEWKRYFSSIYLSAITTALIHWLMIGIVAVKIYADNFITKNDDTNDTGNYIKGYTNSSVLSTGDYKVSPLTGYMIGCTMYLLIASRVIY